jgi:prepilin-type N-terminal cleavage/methylation domain-containing protein
MKTPSRRGRAAFTLIELMAVITIIVILAGIVVGGMGYVNEKQAREKAKIQIALLSKALEEYKLDNGTYPLTSNFADSGTVSTTPILFKALYWDSDNDGAGPPGDTDQKIYLPELDPVNSKQGWTTAPAGSNTKITDPWGQEYRYRTAFRSGTGGVLTPNANAQNPDFDLWSVGKDGSSANANTQKDDIRNF